MSYTLAISELRQLLADSEIDKKATKKKLIGAVDGSNTEFYTYDKRIFEDTFVAYVGGVEVASSVESDIEGKITLAAAPDVNTQVVASYYWKFFTDAELINFLNKGAESTGQFTDVVPDKAYLSIQPGLRTAALYFAANMATKRLIALMQNRVHSEEFLIEQDGNDDTKFSQTLNAMNRQSKDYWDQACWHRDDFYKRLGKRNAPAFAVKAGSVRRYGAIR